MGAVSGLVDMESERGSTLVGVIPSLTDGNRKLAIAGLFRTPERVDALLTGLEKGTVKPAWLTKEQREALLKHAAAEVRSRAAKVLGR